MYKNIKEFKEVALKQFEKLNENWSPVIPAKTQQLVSSQLAKNWFLKLPEYFEEPYLLQQGRTLLRNNAVFHTEINKNHVLAKIFGPQLHTTHVLFQKKDPKKIEDFLNDISNKEDFYSKIMAGLLPNYFLENLEIILPKISEIKFNCNCLEDTHICSHVSCVFYALGVLLDEDPLLILKLMGLDPKNLAQSVISSLQTEVTSCEVINELDLEDLFQIEFSSF